MHKKCLYLNRDQDLNLEWKQYLLDFEVQKDVISHQNLVYLRVLDPSTFHFEFEFD